MAENFLVLVICILISIIDIKTFKIPNKLLLLLIIILFIFDLAGNYKSIPANLCSGVGMFLLFLAIWKGTQGGLGLGDVKFAGVLGYMLGFTTAVFACLAASLFGLSCFLLLRVFCKTSRQSNPLRIPFAPFMTLGMVLVLVAEVCVVW